MIALTSPALGGWKRRQRPAMTRQLRRATSSRSATSTKSTLTAKPESTRTPRNSAITESCLKENGQRHRRGQPFPRPIHHQRCVFHPRHENGQACVLPKPLTQTVREARLMRELAKGRKLATQMGNRAAPRTGCAGRWKVIQSGVIWQPVGIACVVDRPVWPRAWTGRKAKTLCPTMSIGICGLGLPRGGPTNPRPTTPSTGGAGMISAPAPRGHGLPHGQHAFPSP